MASTWGSSWGTSWATSWDRTVTPPATGGPAYDQTPIPGAGSGKRLDHKKLQHKELKRILSELGELPQTAIKVAAIRAEHQKPPKPRKPGQPFVPQEPQTDYAAIAADMQAVQWLLDAYDEVERQRERELLIQLGIEMRLLDDDDDAFMLLM